MSDTSRVTFLMIATILFWLFYIWGTGEIEFGKGLIAGTLFMYAVSLAVIKNGPRLLARYIKPASDSKEP